MALHAPSHFPCLVKTMIQLDDDALLIMQRDGTEKTIPRCDTRLEPYPLLSLISFSIYVQLTKNNYDQIGYIAEWLADPKCAHRWKL